MNKFHAYRLIDGHFTGQAFASNRMDTVTVKAGIGLISGVADWQSQRVDIDTGEVIDYQPPRPSNEHEWNASTKRWQLNATKQAVITNDAKARAELSQIDAKLIRYVDEELEGTIDEEGRKRLAVLRARKRELRTKLR